MKEQNITSLVERVSEKLIKNWPLYSFVTSNPLSGLEDLHFDEAISTIREHLAINGYPSAGVFEQAWNREEIDPELVEKHLLQKNIPLAVEKSLKKMKGLETQHKKYQIHSDVDRHLIKWLTVFLDQGSTEWHMPGRRHGFYKVWRDIASFDHTLSDRKQIHTLPKEPLELLDTILEDYDTDTRESIVEDHLLALPGWTGYISYRAEHEHDWQQVGPVSLIDYLAVRLALCSLLQQDIKTAKEPTDGKQRQEEDALKSAWLHAMEETYQQHLFQQVTSQPVNSIDRSGPSPDAQMVFCIDTRSERIRRAVEQTGPYQTFGYAGFFGVAMDYKHPEKNITQKSCPPILESDFVATSTTLAEAQTEQERFNFYHNLKNAVQRFRFTLENNIPASFGYVESAGIFYGTALLLKTLAPDFVHRLFKCIHEYTGQPDFFSEVTLSHKSQETPATKENLSTAEKAEIARAAFDAMGWHEFAPQVIWVGHGSETANNPFGSSLDCGACAGNKGRHNARVMARICNNEKVRMRLAEEYGINIPNDTRFLAAEHNTTTNHIELFDQQLPAPFKEQLAALKKNLAAAQTRANMEQFNIPSDDTLRSQREATRRAADWAETRPEWGLAGNASFIIGPRELTSHLNLEARSFLHSYNWNKDKDGEQLSAILQGPMVVTQWINNHYYFSSVDNYHFGGGSKVTQNVTGKYGVVQGNGGDLRCGLPQESLQQDDLRQQHFPLRLTVLVYAPRERVATIIQNHRDTLGNLVKNEWIYLAVIDPREDNTISYLGRSGEEAFTGDGLAVS